VTISVVQTKIVANGYTGSFGANVGAGNSVLLAVSAFVGGGTPISSSAPTFGGSPVTGAAKLAEVQHNSSATLYTAIWLLPNVAGGAASFGLTVTGQTNLASTGIIAYEAAGLGAAPTLDQSSTGHAGSGIAISSGPSGNITAAPEFVLGAYCCDSGSTGPPGAPWTSLDISAVAVACAGYQIPLSSGSSFTYTGTQSASDIWSAAVVTVAPTPAAPVAGFGNQQQSGRSMLRKRLWYADV
jgi:hypothetical protein